MSLSSCSQCWDNPCTCGFNYMNWSKEELEQQIKLLQAVLLKKTVKSEVKCELCGIVGCQFGCFHG